ncbi:MAG TPA: polyprenyl synthetase family protein [Bacillota bacterium]|jgi:heptaprenyl diphosphate synthase
MKTTELLGEIQPDLERLEQFMAQCLSDPEPTVKDASLHPLRAGGKRLRPALVLLAAKFHDYAPERLIPVAAGVELMHMATLVHDDVIDDSPTRRGLSTVNSRWSNKVSVLVGDHLFAAAVALIAQNSDNETIKLLAHTISEVVRGEIKQTNAGWRLGLTEAEYVERIGLKTASFFGACCHVGARLSGAPEGITLELRQYGLEIGVAFQMMDDVLDVNGDARDTGKPVGGDLKSGVLTLPVIYALAHSPDRARLEALIKSRSFNNGQLEEALEVVRKSGGVEYTLKTAAGYVDRAKVRLEGLPDRPTKGTLLSLADFMANRAV